MLVVEEGAKERGAVEGKGVVGGECNDQEGTPAPYLA